MALRAARVGAVEGLVDVLGVGHVGGESSRTRSTGSSSEREASGTLPVVYGFGSGGSGARGRRPANITPSPSARISAGQ